MRGTRPTIRRYSKKDELRSRPLRHLALMLSSHDAKHGKHQEGDYQADGNDCVEISAASVGILRVL